MKTIIPAMTLCILISTSAYANDREAATQRLLEQGYTAKQVQELNRSYDSFSEKKSSAFDKKRLLQENVIVRDAAKSGDFAAALNKIEKLKSDGGYTDKWAMRLVSDVQWAMQLEQLKAAMR